MRYGLVGSLLIVAALSTVVMTAEAMADGGYVETTGSYAEGDSIRGNRYTTGGALKVDLGGGGAGVVDTELPAAAAIAADNQAAPTAPGVYSYLMCFDGALWDRCLSGLTDTDDGTIATAQVPNLGINLTYVFDGTNWVRFRLATGVTAAAPPLHAHYVAGLGSGATGGFLTAPAVCDTFANINIVTATTTLIVTGVSGRHVRICGISMLTTLANNVAFVSGTGATCATGTTGMTGGTTAVTGYNLPVAGNIQYGSGIGAINQTNATGDSVCIITSVITQLSGRISYAIY